MKHNAKSNFVLTVAFGARRVYSYQYQHLPTVEKRRLQSGIRTAAYLDKLIE
jgi:hypothetical protein